MISFREGPCLYGLINGERISAKSFSTEAISLGNISLHSSE